MSYKKEQKRRHLALLADRPELFGGDSGGGLFGGLAYPIVLTDGRNNLYPPIVAAALAYFARQRIVWWAGAGPTGHLLSSQISCLNHLFSLRKDPAAALAVARALDPTVAEALPVEDDGGLIAFEAVSPGDYLGEGELRRGADCTCIDALLAGRRADGAKVLLPVEWKHIERYDSTDKLADPKRGTIRRERYEGLAAQSAQLRGGRDSREIYGREPYYQLMRQTLWAEQMVRHGHAGDYVHAAVIPAGNLELRQKSYGGGDLEAVWRAQLKTQSRFALTTPQNLLAGLDRAKYAPLLEYLAARYWG
ncbi:hypothetical protein FACS1894186_4690 [Alphaproteobacteria bacterium]|nr:hypothetical protein FACS1894186_4690 [Alphaproteobacteria bacterium]